MAATPQTNTGRSAQFVDTGMQVALFTFNHTSGSSSTGAIGFTPKACFYTGVVNFGTVNGDVSISNGFATGTSTNARGNGFSFTQGPGSPQLPGATGTADGAAIGGGSTATQNTTQTNTSFSRQLTVTAFSSAGITLTWSLAVNAHSGSLLVIG